MRSRRLESWKRKKENISTRLKAYKGLRRRLLASGRHRAGNESIKSIDCSRFDWSPRYQTQPEGRALFKRVKSLLRWLARYLSSYPLHRCERKAHRLRLFIRLLIRLLIRPPVNGVDWKCGKGLFFIYLYFFKIILKLFLGCYRPAGRWIRFRFTFFLLLLMSFGVDSFIDAIIFLFCSISWTLRVLRSPCACRLVSKKKQTVSCFALKGPLLGRAF